MGYDPVTEEAHKRARGIDYLGRYEPPPSLPPVNLELDLWRADRREWDRRRKLAHGNARAVLGNVLTPVVPAKIQRELIELYVSAWLFANPLSPSAHRGRKPLAASASTLGAFAHADGET